MVMVSEDVHGGLVLAESGGYVGLAVSPDEPACVLRAVRELAHDFERVCGCTAVVVSSAQEAEVVEPEPQARVVVGCAGSSVLPDDLDLSGLRDTDGAWRAEGFLIEVREHAVYLVGADPRGTMYAVYDLAESMGVSPWHWFADVPVRRRSRVVLDWGTRVVDWPSVEYRGIFINDEEELDAWARLHTSDGGIGPTTYEHIFDLVLRLKGNYVWPAMHVNSFHANPANVRLASEMGVVIGTSHCDILGRNNVHEWEAWVQAQGEPVEYDASLPGRNHENLLQYWRERVAQCSDSEMSWTLGMRGIHDSGLTAAVIDGGDASESEKARARGDLLSALIAEQRSILSEELGSGSVGGSLTTDHSVRHPAPCAEVAGRRIHTCQTDSATDPVLREAAVRGMTGDLVSCHRFPNVLQIFVPYKEVLDLYDQGLNLPEDVTVIWSDDNFGYMRRFPSGPELNRSGGHGLYYHCSYWSMPPRTYLFVGSTPLRQMAHELQRAWDKGIRRVWVNNVGPIKRRELETEFFLRMAWDVGKKDLSPSEFLAEWADRTFSGMHGQRLAGLWARFEEVHTRKAEHLVTGCFSQTGQGDEASRRLRDLWEVRWAIQDMMASLPEEERDAFFQLIALKTEVAYLVSAHFYFADRSLLANEQGKMAAADRYVEASRRFQDMVMVLVAWYNESMAGGKWRGVLAPQASPPPRMVLNALAKPALTCGGRQTREGVGVVAWGEEMPGEQPLLNFDQYGVTHKWIEVFPLGFSDSEFRIESDSWIEVSTRAGTVGTERRIGVSVLDMVSHAGQSGWISVRSGQAVTQVRVDVGQVVALPGDFRGWVEADGYVSMSPAQETVTDASRHSAPSPCAQVAGRSILLTNIDPATTRRMTVEVADGYVSMAPAQETLADASRHVGPSPCAQVAGRGIHPTSVDSATSRGMTVELATNQWFPSGGDFLVGPTGETTYPFYLVTPGVHRLRVHRYPSLNSSGRIRAQVVVDGLHVIGIESATTDEYQGNWEETVRANVEVLEYSLPHLDSGPHTLTLKPMDDCFIATKLVICTSECPCSELGPPLSHHTERVSLAVPDPDPEEFLCWDDEALAHAPAWVAPTLYVDRAFWASGDPMFAQPRKAAGVGVQAKLSGREKAGSTTVDHDAGSQVCIAIEAESVLGETESAWMTPSAAGECWTHTQAETANRTGLAMVALSNPLNVEVGTPPQAPKRWESPESAPALHYRIQVSKPGMYHVWLLVWFSSQDDDSCWVCLDGVTQPLAEQFSRGELYGFGTQAVWHWTHLSDLHIPAGEHTLSLHARKAGFRVDRIWLSLSDDDPPDDAHFPA